MVSDGHARVAAIRAAIRAAEHRLRARHPWLAHQDRLGLAAFVACLVAMAGVSAGYLRGMLPWWLVIPSMALPLSILHELEHDLIHDQYFRGRRWLKHAMLLGIWAGKLGANPWYREVLHLKHHGVSGQHDDVEERLIGIGLPVGVRRLFVSMHPLGSLLLFHRVHRDAPDFRPLWFLLISSPAVLAELAGWAACLRVLPFWTWSWGADFAVLLLAPNMLRHASLVLMSSYSHYYEDIPRGDVFHQNQIVHHWMVAPFQLFCFNFGTTHIIHHYVVNQPFYLRQAVARDALAALVRHGAPVNDFGIVRRANRRTEGHLFPAVAAP